MHGWRLGWGFAFARAFFSELGDTRCKEAIQRFLRGFQTQRRNLQNLGDAC
jgi:hypothetical protein